jgi:hypothetical protein
LAQSRALTCGSKPEGEGCRGIDMVGFLTRHAPKL